jgi:hypothetical protein
VAGAESLDRPRVCLRFLRPPRIHDPEPSHPQSLQTTNHGNTLQATQRGGDLHWSRGPWRAQKASTQPISILDFENAPVAIDDPATEGALFVSDLEDGTLTNWS